VDIGLYLRGLAIGFAVAFALGPVGLLVIRRTIDRGWGHGFVSGLGVATADTLYAAVAAFGLTALTSALVGVDRILGIAGGVVLLALAFIGLRSVARPRAITAPSGDAPLAPAPAAGLPGKDRSASFLGAWATMAGLTLTNPATPVVVRGLNLVASLVIGAFGLGAIAAGLLIGQGAA
jgi:threonine/homoserine/homoserine lactone efflux protein